MKRTSLLLALICSVMVTTAPAMADGDFFVVAGGGPSGKVLKTQVLTSLSYISESNLGTNSWAKLDSPQWAYTKLSPTSYLVITYHDTFNAIGGWSFYQLRVNDQASVVGQDGAYLAVYNGWDVSGVTGVWSGLPKGDVNLSIWHRQYGCTYCARSNGGFYTSVTVMEIEK